MKINIRKNLRVFLWCLGFAFFILPIIIGLIRNISEFKLQSDDFVEILNFYTEFFNSDFMDLFSVLFLFLCAILCFILFKLAHYFHSSLSIKIGSRKVLIIYILLILLPITDFVLEYPLLLNQEILFHKSPETHYYYSSMEYQISLSADEICDIYFTVLDKDSCFVSNQISNTTGILVSNNGHCAPIEKDIQERVMNFWSEKGFKNNFVSDYNEILKDRLTDRTVINKYAFVEIGPIKKIDGDIYIGYSEYRGILCAFGYLLKLNKHNGKWTKIQSNRMWIS